MNRRLGRLVVGVVLSVLIPVPTVVATVSTATAAEACEPTHPPARIHSLHALDVVPGTLLAPNGVDPHRTVTLQRFRLFADNPCNGSGYGCPQDAPACPAPRYTHLTVTGKRTLGSGALCRFQRYEDGPRYEFDPASGRYSYSGAWYWTDSDNANGTGTGPKLSNKCAGAYDVVVTLRNENQDKTLISGSNTYRQRRSFVVRRPARMTTNVAAETVRVGSTIPVRGRLTRTDWDKPHNPQAAYAGQRVFLQRATSINGYYHTLRAVVTDKHGYGRTDVKALSGTRCYRWVFQTNSTTQRKVSDPDCVVAN